jgi:hypothetical protein
MFQVGIFECVLQTNWRGIVLGFVARLVWAFEPQGEDSARDGDVTQKVNDQADNPNERYAYIMSVSLGRGEDCGDHQAHKKSRKYRVGRGVLRHEFINRKGAQDECNSGQGRLLEKFS